ncbi:MAG: hypothetical protein RIG61_03455 [Deltaproteobacteria bacterium]
MSNPKQTRKQAVDEGKLRDVSEVAKEAGVLIPVYITSTVWDSWITPDQEGMKKGEDENTRLRNTMDKLLYYIRVHRQTNRSNLIYFPVPLTKKGEIENVQLLSYLGPVEKTDHRPCITIMTPEEYDQRTTN